MIRQMLREASFLFTTSASIWFVVWAIRRQAEVDEKLDRVATILRWSVVTLGYLTASLPVMGIGWLQVLAFVVGLLFLCWPNFAYRLRSFLWGKSPAEGTEQLD